MTPGTSPPTMSSRAYLELKCMHMKDAQTSLMEFLFQQETSKENEAPVIYEI